MFYFNDQNRYFGVRTNSVSKSFTQKYVLTYLRSFSKAPSPPPPKFPLGDKVCRLSFSAPANPLENKAGASMLFPKESKLPLPHWMRTGLYATDEETKQFLLLQVVRDGRESKKRYQRQKEGPQRTTSPSQLLWAPQREWLAPLLLQQCLGMLPVTPPPWTGSTKLAAYLVFTCWFIPSPSTLFTIQFNSEHLLLSTY